MNMFGSHKKKFTFTENNCLAKICEIVKASSYSNIMVSIYLIKKDSFLYCNEAFKKSIGKNYEKLLENGWEFWFSLIDTNESVQVKNKLVYFFSKLNLQKSCILKYHMINFYGDRVFVKHEILLYKLEKDIFAVSYFFNITLKEKIGRYFEVVEDYNVYNLKNESIKIISAREREVLSLVADGFSSKQIADKLFISCHTAISHRKNLIEKFKVKNTAQLIKRASRTSEFW